MKSPAKLTFKYGSMLVELQHQVENGRSERFLHHLFGIGFKNALTAPKLTLKNVRGMPILIHNESEKCNYDTEEKLQYKDRQRAISASIA